MTTDFIRKAEKTIDKLLNDNYQFYRGFASTKLKIEDLFILFDDNIKSIVRLKNSNDDYIASFSMSEMPGCCGVAITHDMYVIPSYRNKGLGTILNKLAINIAKEENYKILLVTDLVNNKAQSKLMKNNGFITLTKFKNKNTLNMIKLSVKKL